jgi:hypothetical protein
MFVLEKNKNQLAAKVIARISLYLSVIFLLMFIITAFALFYLYQHKAKNNLMNYKNLKGPKEEWLMLNAEKNHNRMLEEFKMMYQQYLMTEKNKLNQFKKIIKKSDDDHWRSIKKQGSDSRVYIQKNAIISDDLKRKIMVALTLTKKFGPSYHHTYKNTYFSFPEKAIVIYWPDEDN